jgi:methylenetetrahydrofolate dehydrogenase (NADP+)/methenyltetrahydrofolate cyclohydrolase
MLNKNIHIHGYIVQLPLPHHINTNTITMAIAAEKDIDGFHPTNQ